MSGFKNNTRFSSLLNEGSKKETNKDNEKKDTQKNNETKKHGLDNSFKKTNNKYYSDDKLSHDIKREEERKIKEQQTKLVLTTENFPELAPKSVENIASNGASTINYSIISEKLTTSIVEKKSTPDVDDGYKNLLPGWTMLKKDIDKNRIIMRTKDLATILEKNVDNNFEVLDALVELHEIRCNEYIENWGYDEWDRMFKFTNYDYSYFDKLDELYYQEVSSEHSDEDDDDTNFDDHNYDYY